MKRFVVASVACLVAAAFPGADASPARLPFDLAPPKHADMIEMAGTRWYGSDIESGDWEITFEKGGKITYTYKGRTFRNGSWQWQGDALYFETNKKYYEFRGTLQGNSIDGESWNVKGIRWHTSMYRVDDSK